MKDIKKIQEFFSKPLGEVKKDEYGNHQEPQFKKGDKVTYLGNPGEITGVNKEMTGAYTYNVSYDKGNGKTKASNISNKNGTDIKLAEAMDFNDPVLMKFRAMKSDKEKLAQMRAANAGDDGNDKFFRNAKKIAALKKYREQLMRDMEQEAEPEGGPIADKYGAELNKIDKAISMLREAKEETAVDRAKKQLDALGVKYEMSKTDKVRPFKVIYKPVNKSDKFYDEFEDIVDLFNLKGFVKTSMNETKSISDYKVGDIISFKDGEDWKVMKVKDNVGKLVVKPHNEKAKKGNVSLEIDIDADYLKKNLSEAKSEDKVDTITMDVPLFIRMLEYSREDAKKDVDLHDVTDKAISLGKERGILSMEDYDAIVGTAEEIDEAELTEANVPSNIAEFAKRKGISSLVRKVAGWAEKAGARIAGGTAIGKNYNTLVLDLDYKQQGEIRIDCDEETIELYDEPVYDFKSFQRVYIDGKDGNLEEGTEEQLSFISKARAKSSLKQYLSGKRDDGMGKFDAIVYGIDNDGNKHQIKSYNDLQNYEKFALGNNPDVAWNGKQFSSIAEKVISQIKEDRPGLWANIHAQRERGEKPARKGSKDYKAAVKAGKKINAMTEAEEAEKVLADTPDNIEAALAKALKMSPEELEKKITSKDKKEKLDESLTVTLALLLPAILELTGGLANKIKQQFLPAEQKDELNKMLKQIKDIKEKHDIGKYIDNPLNDTPEQKQAKGHIKQIRKEIESKFGAKVPWLKWDEEKGFVSDTKTLGQLGHKLHHVYTSPIVAFLRLASIVPGTPKMLKDKKTRQKIADILYAAAMLYLGGAHVKHGLHDILAGHGVDIVKLADTVGNGYKTGLSFAEVAGEALNAAGVGIEAGTELSA